MPRQCRKGFLDLDNTLPTSAYSSHKQVLESQQPNQIGRSWISSRSHHAIPQPTPPLTGPAVISYFSGESQTSALRPVRQLQITGNPGIKNSVLETVDPPADSAKHTSSHVPTTRSTQGTYLLFKTPRGFHSLAYPNPYTSLHYN